MGSVEGEKGPCHGCGKTIDHAPGWCHDCSKDADRALASGQHPPAPAHFLKLRGRAR